ncbi:hypothetical protein DFQ30_008606 [Apophysomyces sp. BC1015]|nr:hypothetical protein DFQ30_008606 [Apophysomyces sp. BC1015]
MAADKDQRQAFIQWNLDQISKYNTDGVDIDWEYPGRQGAGCNVFDKANDATNFLVLLKELRAAMDGKFGAGKKELSIAAHVRTFVVPSGYMTDVSEFGKVLDRVNIMSYDINGAWNSTTGPNAPFQVQPGFGDDNSFVSSIQTWIKAGIPADKIASGLAFYGRSATTTVDMTKSKSQYQPQVAGNPPHGDSLDAWWQDPYCSADKGGLSGVWRYGNLRSEGVLTSPTTAASPWVRTWDDTSKTPWLFNPSSNIFISYDDPESIKVKVNYAQCQKLGGLMVWSVDEDTNDHELLNEVYKFKSEHPTPITAHSANDRDQHAMATRSSLPQHRSSDAESHQTIDMSQRAIVQVIRIERDYSQGDGITRFVTIVPEELDDRISHAQVVRTVETINSMLQQAEKLSLRTAFDNIMECLTIYTWPLIVPSYYQQSIKRLLSFIDSENKTIYNAQGLEISNPVKAAFLFLEIKVFENA